MTKPQVYVLPFPGKLDIQKIKPDNFRNSLRCQLTSRFRNLKCKDPRNLPFDEEVNISAVDKVSHENPGPGSSQKIYKHRFHILLFILSQFIGLNTSS